jgi:hypothetical protein
VKALDFGMMWRTICFVAWLKLHALKRVWKVTQKRLHRFAGLISFCGVAVVLATFVVKDVLRDEEKDTLTKMENAYRAADSMKAIYMVSMQVEDLTRTSGSKESSASELFNELDLILPVLNRLEILSEALPKKDRDYIRPGESSLSLKQFWKDYAQIRHSSGFPLWWPSEEASKALLSSAVDLDSDLTIFELEMRSRLESASSKAKHRLRRFTNWSYFLYSIGILTGVLGQVAGVKPSGGE